MTYGIPSENPVLVFDWGDTVMKVLPEYTGPMASWPQVAEVDGIVEALEALKDHFHLAIATNASDSDSTQVWKALRRVGLGEYFKGVFTSKELGSRKPEIKFYRQLESVLDRSASRMIMVGDSFTTDVLGAKQAGWWAIWYNPARQAAPGLLPLHDAEISDLRRLPELLERPVLPSYTTTLAWLLERGMPHNILTHVGLVAAAAYQLAVWLNAAGVALNPILVHRGALLHDLAKMDSIRAKKERGELGDHGRMARDLLLERGQPELAEIADRHMVVNDPSSPRAPITWEQKLVHFADKLAEGSTLVTLEERLEALKGRYPEYSAELAASQPFLIQLQDEICAPLNLPPADLFTRLQKAIQGMA